MNGNVAFRHLAMEGFVFRVDSVVLDIAWFAMLIEHRETICEYACRSYVGLE